MANCPKCNAELVEVDYLDENKTQIECSECHFKEVV